MKKFIAYAIGLTQIIGMSVLTFENNTNLARRWEQDRASVEAKMTLNHTSRDGFNKKAFDANVFHVDTYSDAYKCASKKDVTKCRSSYSY